MWRKNESVKAEQAQLECVLSFTFKADQVNAKPGLPDTMKAEPYEGISKIWRSNQ